MLTVLLGLLIAYGVVQYLRLPSTDVGADTRDNRGAALAAARLEAINLTTLDYKDSETAISRILSGATGALATEFERQRTQLGPVLTQVKSVSNGSVLEAGLVRIDETSAQALVAVDTSVSTQPEGAKKAQTLRKHLRFSMTLQKINGRWLVADVNYAGVVQ